MNTNMSMIKILKIIKVPFTGEEKHTHSYTISAHTHTNVCQITKMGKVYPY